jgi:hypothetical protein
MGLIEEMKQAVSGSCARRVGKEVTAPVEEHLERTIPENLLHVELVSHQPQLQHVNVMFIRISSVSQKVEKRVLKLFWNSTAR